MQRDYLDLGVAAAPVAADEAQAGRPNSEVMREAPSIVAISSSDGRRAKRLAASRKRGSSERSPAVLRNTPGRPIAQCTARSMSGWTSSGWYHVVGVRSVVAQGPRAMD